MNYMFSNHTSSTSFLFGRLGASWGVEQALCGPCAEDENFTTKIASYVTKAWCQ